ncbi:MAG: hypothetical protein ACI8Z9_000287 [Paraglaciecola sp.]|jgi:hypothetical protein
MKIMGVIFLLLSMSLCATVVYKKVNQDGSITFSDVPSEGAVRVDLASGNSVVMPALVLPQAKINKTVKILKQAQIPYQLNIISPTPEQTMRSNNGEMNVLVNITPNVPGQYQLMLNGVLHSSQTSGTFRLEGMHRGEYSVQVRFMDNSGKVLALSDMQTVYLHKASALFKGNE